MSGLDASYSVRSGAQLNNTDVKDLNVTTASVGDLNVTTASVGSIETDVITSGGLTHTTVVGYAPNTFSTLANVTTLSLLNVAGADPATASTDSRLVVIPANAVITDILIDDNGTAIAPSGNDFQIGSTTTFDASSVTIMDGSSSTGANIASKILIRAGVLGFPYNEAIPDAVAGLGGFPLSIASDSFVTITNVSGGANTAGDFRVIISYYV